MSKKSHVLVKAQKELESWLNDSFNYSFMYERARNDLKNYLDENLGDTGTILESLSSMAYWYGSSGVSKILSHKQTGYSDLYNMYVCGLLRAKFSLNIYQKNLNKGIGLFFKTTKKNDNPRFSFIEHGTLLANGLTLGSFEDAEKIGEIILDLLEQDQYYAQNAINFPHYILKLFCKTKGLSFPNKEVSNALPEEYQNLIKEFDTDDVNRFDFLIRKACDYHILYSGENTDGDDKEFSDPIYILFPTEILATYQLRSLLRKPIIFEDTHPLIQDYFVTYKEIKNVEIDYLLKSLLVKIENL